MNTRSCLHIIGSIAAAGMAIVVGLPSAMQEADGVPQRPIVSAYDAAGGLVIVDDPTAPYVGTDPSGPSQKVSQSGLPSYLRSGNRRGMPKSKPNSPICRQRPPRKGGRRR